MQVVLIDETFDSLDWEPVMEAEFFHWLNEIDKGLVRAFGLGREELPDQCYADWFADGLAPQEAVELILEEMGVM